MAPSAEPSARCRFCARGLWLIENALPPLRRGLRRPARAARQPDHRGAALRDEAAVGAPSRAPPGRDEVARAAARSTSSTASRICEARRLPGTARASRCAQSSTWSGGGSATRRATLEKTPAYLFRPIATKRMHELPPDARLIVLAAQSGRADVLELPPRAARGRHRPHLRAGGRARDGRRSRRTASTRSRPPRARRRSWRAASTTTSSRASSRCTWRERVHVERSESYFRRRRRVDGALARVPRPAGHAPPGEAGAPAAVRQAARRAAPAARGVLPAAHNRRLEELLGRSMQWDGEGKA